MATFFDEYLDRLEALHAEIEGAMEGLPQAALDWAPAADVPSICVLVTHLTGAERYWIGDVAGVDSSGRDREAEFRAQGTSLSALKKGLQNSRAYARGLLGKLELGDLEAMRVSTRDARPFSVAWALLHALEHTAIHLGHVQILRQLWDQRETS